METYCGESVLNGSTPRILGSDAKAIVAKRVEKATEVETPTTDCHIFVRSPGLAHNDYVTSIQLQRFEGVMRLAVGWLNGRVDVFARGENERARLWYLSPTENILTECKHPGIQDVATFAVFSPTADQVTVNAINGTIMFFRGTDRELVCMTMPEQTGKELNGMDATTDGVLPWYRGADRIIQVK